ncbi:MAG: hypothetical protein LCH56_16505 [Proteobacteria bacterium]|nr:hypothetical protein [Pseudomonadota bacterium]
MSEKKQRDKILAQEMLVRREIDKLRDLIEQYGRMQGGARGTDAVLEALKRMNVLGNDPIDSFNVDLAQWALMSSLKPLGNDPIDSFSVKDYQKLVLKVFGNDPIDSFSVALVIRIGLKLIDATGSTRSKKAPKKKSAKKARKK